MFEQRQEFEVQSQNLKEAKEKLKLDETKTMAEITERIKISTERDELRHQFKRLKDIEEEQDAEIQRRKQNYNDLNRSVNEKDEKIQDNLKEFEDKKARAIYLMEETMVQKTEIDALKKECGLYRDLKNIDIEEIRQM